MKTFISAGWPYLYDVPGLHNCVPMLFADAYARFFRASGEEVFFLCGGDEHGSRIEFVARGLGRRPRDLVDEKYAATLPLLARLGISVDRFGRTTDVAHGHFVREFVGRLVERGRAFEGGVDVPYCAACDEHLPDRFVRGRCPHCGDATFGGQCSNKRSCGRMIESLVEGTCALCSGPIRMCQRWHVLFEMEPYSGAVLPQLASDGPSGPEVLRRVEETFRDVAQAALTRDTSWGIALEGEGDAGRTVYSWVDALLAKVSMTPARFFHDESARKVFFLGMDGVPFYGALLPALLVAAGREESVTRWTLIPNEVLIYEGGVCSKSTGTGIWLEEALSVLDPDSWRFHVYDTYARGEKHADFRWETFAQNVRACLHEALGSNLERAAAEEDSGSLDAERLESIRSRFRSYDTAGAFREAIALATDRGASRVTLQAAMPLLASFVPGIAERAARRLEGTGPPVFEGPPPSPHELRSRYQTLVDERMDRRTLEEEVTHLRADDLCVCPIDLQER